MADLGEAGNNFDYESAGDDETLATTPVKNDNAFYTGILWGGVLISSTTTNEYHEQERIDMPVHTWG